MNFKPGGPIDVNQPRPLVEHLVEKVPDGVSWMQAWIGPLWIHPCFTQDAPPEAPAVSLVEHADAVREELNEAEDFPKLSTSVLGCQRKNASRSYKRIVNRFGYSLKLGFTLAPTLYMFNQKLRVIWYI